MERAYLEEKSFENIIFSEEPLAPGEYENCSFVNCDFSNADLSNMHFSECTFRNCNLSLARTENTVFRDVKFSNCKILGMHFEKCKELLFKVDFENCVLNLSSFYKRKLKNTVFKNSSLQDVDFTEADLTNALIDNCDLNGATFEYTILEKADLRTAYNYSLDPEKNRVKKANFSLQGIGGLLHKYDIGIE